MCKRKGEVRQSHVISYIRRLISQLQINSAMNLANIHVISNILATAMKPKCHIEYLLSDGP